MIHYLIYLKDRGENRDRIERCDRILKEEKLFLRDDVRVPDIPQES